MHAHTHVNIGEGNRLLVSPLGFKTLLLCLKLCIYIAVMCQVKNTIQFICNINLDYQVLQVK